jgi:hypothetical protein
VSNIKIKTVHVGAGGGQERRTESKEEEKSETETLKIGKVLGRCGRERERKKMRKGCRKKE